MDKKLEKWVNHIKEMSTNSGDLKIRVLPFQGKKVATVYFESVSSGSNINDFILKALVYAKKPQFFQKVFLNLQNQIPSNNVKILTTYEDVFFHLASGFTCLFLDGYPKAIAIETRKELSRSISESSSESIIRGPKDSFTENHSTNLGLIRKRIKDPNLVITDLFLGKRTKTKVSIIYIKDIADTKKVNRILEKLKQINVDGILDSGHIREFLIRHQNTVFPKVISTERPDLACSSLLNGKIVIMVESTPYVLIIPALFFDFFKNPEDYYQMPINISFTRILRYLAFFITIMAPAIYIAITTFHIEMLPSSLLFSLYTQKFHVPFPTAFEVLLLMITFEILKECDIRTPSAMGTSMSIVGGLVLGDAAVSAGIVSSISVIMVAITSISGLLFSDIDMINGIRFWRLFFILASTFLGMIGFILALIIFISKLSSVKVMGIDYLTPLTPFNFVGFKDSFFRLPKNKDKYRPSYLTDKNQKKLGDSK